MKLLAEDKEYLVIMIIEKFRLTRAGAERIIEKADNFLQRKDSAILYDMAYTFSYRNSVRFVKKLLSHALECFMYLYNKEYYRPFRKELESLYQDFQSDLSIQLFDYRCRIEKRSDDARRILLHTSKRLSNTLDTQGLMIANISHEMRTSLNAIYGYLSFIDEDDILHAEQKQYLAKASQATSSLKALVTDILNVTKINSGQIEIIKESFWLDKMILKCIDQISFELNAKLDITLKTVIDFLPTKVYGDQNHIMEIIINILSNAVKYTAHGTILLSLSYQYISDDTIALDISVEDTGIGMTMEQANKVFAPYSRFKTEEKGVGLGLHIANELSKKLDAKLIVESEFGVGSKFHFSIDLIIDDKCKIDLTDQDICYYIGNDSDITLENKLDFLKNNGATVYACNKESKFIHYLLTIKTNPPDYIMIISDKKGYVKFDALIYYLKTLDIYKKTIFVAEDVDSNISLRYFTKIYEYLAPISIYSGKKVNSDKKDMDFKNTISVLAIDDMDTNLEILKMFITKLFPNIDIDLVSDGNTAIDMFKNKRYDLVFLDLKMPKINGFEILKILRELSPSITAYAFTADVYKSNYDKVLDAGFTGLLEKPLNPKALEKIVQGVVNEKNS